MSSVLRIPLNIYKKLVWDRIEGKEMDHARSRLQNTDFTIITSNCVGGYCIICSD